MRKFLAVMLAVLLSASASWSQDDSFKKDNPDVDKYDFTKSFIMSLSSYSRVADRLGKEDRDTVASKSDDRAIHEFIDHRTLDNTELRIAKNYLVRYTQSANGLVRKISFDTIAVYEKLIAMSVRERRLWQVFEHFRATGLPRDFNEDEFGQQQIRLAKEKKEVAKELIRQSTLVVKAMLSAERCESEDCRELAFTQVERDKLAKKIDGVAKGNMDWGMKVGQSTLEACAAILREALEDSLFHSRP